MRARYYRALIKWLPKQDERVPELTAYGYITSKHNTIVSSLEHATDIPHLSARPLTDPAPLNYVRSPELTAAYNLDITHADYTHATLPHNTEVSLPQLRKASRKVCDLITSTIDEESVRARYEAECDFNGLELLRNLRAEVERDLDGCSSDAIDDVIEALIRQGMESASVSSFIAFDDELIAWNECHFDVDRALKPPALASTLIRVVRRSIGKIAFGTIKVSLDTANIGVDRLIKVRRVIEGYFANETTIAMQDGLLGTAGELLAATDPKRHAAGEDRNTGQPPPSSYVPSMEVLRRMAAGEQPPGKCNYCQEEGHWELFCPSRLRGDERAARASRSH